jgi:hypothetical protein
LAVLSVIAIRVLGLRWQWDARPEANAEEVASPVEIAVVAQWTRGPKPERTTVRWFVEGGTVGRLAGPPR